MQTVGFCDDVGMVVISRTTQTLEVVANESLRRASKWLSENGLTLATNKTEAVLITDKGIFTTPSIAIEGEVIQWQKSLRYLGAQY